MEKKFNADLAAKIKEPLTQALIAVRVLSNMGFNHVQFSQYRYSIQIDIFEDTIAESLETHSLLEQFLENGWDWYITDHSKDKELPYTCLHYRFNFED